MPASVNTENYRKYRHSTAITGFKGSPERSHLIVAQKGWQEVAEYAISWVEAQLDANEAADASRQVAV